jgi:hypothetical protein
MWAAAPSSAWGAVPCKAMKINTVARAPRDIATGRKALGCFSIVNGFIFATLIVSLWGDVFATSIKYFAVKSKRENRSLFSRDH